MRFIRVTSIAIGFLCLLASGPLRAEIVPGTILSPDTTVMLPNFDGHITWERGSSTNFDTLDALLCRQGEESWHFVSFFSEATEVATGQLEPGVAMECKVRTRSVENQSEWVDSESRMWAVDPSWSTFGLFLLASAPTSSTIGANRETRTSLNKVANVPAVSPIASPAAMACGMA